MFLMERLFVATEERLLLVEEIDDGHAVTETVLAAADIEAIAVHADHPDRVFCATFDRGLQRSSDGGASWERVGASTIESDAVTAVTVDPSDPAVVYAGTEPSRVYRSTDAGETWTHCAGLTDLQSASDWRFPPRPDTHHVRWIEVAPNDPDTVHVSIEAGALVRSTDAGRTWQDRVRGSPRDVHSMATHPAAPGRVWAAAGDGYAESTNGGETWSYPETGLSVGYCWSVAVDPGDPETVLLSAASGARTAHSHSRAESFVFRRSDGGRWEPVDDSLPTGAGVVRYEIASGTRPGEFVAASNSGLFRSRDGGRSWQPLALDPSSALDSATVEGLAVLG